MCDALIVIGPDVAHDHDAFRQVLVDSVVVTNESDNIGMAYIIEAKVLAGKRASTKELRQLAKSSEWHLAMRAVIELLERDELAQRDLDALQTLATTSLPGVSVRPSEDLMRATRMTPTEWSGPAAQAATRAVSHLAMASLGKTPWTVARCAEDLAGELSIKVADVPDFMRNVCADRLFVAHAKAIEQRALTKWFWMTVKR